MENYNRNLERFFSSQLSEWGTAGKNYADLADVKFREFYIGRSKVLAMHNPCRIRSCAAKVDTESVKARKCFLCKENRPVEQIEMRLSGMDGFVVLVNPFPICDPHFVIADEGHNPQDKVPDVIRKAAEFFTDYVVFYNGACAGASAPDHLHLQMVRKEAVPLLEWVDNDILHDLPFEIIHTAGDDSWEAVKSYKKADNANFFVWQDDSGKLHSVIIPRGAHRPGCYFEEGNESLLVSPGALDMGGLIVLPRPGDLEKITTEKITEIYEETGIRKKHN